MMGMTAAEIRALPMSGAGWSNVVTQSDKTIVVNMSSSGISSQAAAHSFSAALRYVRTGQVAYRTKVVEALEKVRTWDYANNGYYSTYERQLTGWLMAADLVNHRTPEFLAFVDKIRFVDLPGHSAWGGLFKSSHRSANNHGQLARASLLAANLFLGDMNKRTPSGNPGGVEQDIRYFRAYLGDTSFYGTYAGTSASVAWGGFGTGSDGWNYGGTYMHSTKANVWAPINPVSSGPTKDGAINQDAHRDQTSFALDSSGRPILGSGGAMYSYTAGNGILMEATLLAAAGYTDVWQWSDQAVLRWRAFLHRWNYGQTHPSVHGWIDPLLNHIYGTGYPAVDEQGYGLTGTRWLSHNANWLKR
jgi:hypothetical protein